MLKHKLVIIVVLLALAVIVGGSLASAADGGGDEPATPTIVHMKPDIGAHSESEPMAQTIVRKRDHVAAQSGQTPATPTAPIEGAPIDRIEVYIHVNDIYPSLHTVPKSEWYARGYDNFGILCSGSMLPTINCEDIGYSFPVDPIGDEEPVPLFVGEVATYLIDEDLAACFASHGWDVDGAWQADTYILHRIIEITDEGYRFQGDNNQNPDICLVPRENIIDVLVGLRRPINLGAISIEHMREIVALFFTGAG